MSTKYTNMNIQVIKREAPDHPTFWDLIVAVIIVNAVPKVKGQNKPKKGSVCSTVFRFTDEDLALSARNMLEKAFDDMLPIVTQYGVLVPVDEEDAAKTLIVPGGGP